MQAGAVDRNLRPVFLVTGLTVTAYKTAGISISVLLVLWTKRFKTHSRMDFFAARLSVRKFKLHGGYPNGKPLASAGP